MTVASVIFLAVMIVVSIVTYYWGRARGISEKLPDALTKGELADTVRELQNLKSQLEGQHTAVVSEKDRMLSSANAENQRLRDLATENEQKMRQINDSLTTISQQAVTEVRNMSGAIEPVIAMFKTPQMAGIAYAEASLEVLLETHLGNGLYERKPRLLASGNETVDFIIKLPDCVVPIDSKFPEQKYRAWVEAPEAEVKVRWREFRDAVIEQLNKISRYIQPGLGTTDYALVFFPTDAVWHQAFVVTKWYGEDNPLPRKSQELRVFGCSSQTLMPYLGLLRLGLRNLRLSEDVKGVQQMVSQLETSWGQLEKDWGTLLGHLRNAYNFASGMIGSRGSLSQVDTVVGELSKSRSKTDEGSQVLLENQPIESEGVR
ncbi:MAG: DNA recombination protein RmuC [Candidatus Omnitrophota bacterium]|nr:DNA recombination protein RmuC [Candidatus Omnitrophota bacterium]